MVLPDATAILGAPILLLGTGMLAGLYHAFEPDHVATMMANVTTARRRGRDGRSTVARLKADCLKNSMYGLLWGLGHTSTIFLMIIAVFVLSTNMPSMLFAWFELAVCAMMVVLGMSACMNRMPWQRQLHLHPHRHEDGTVHTHPHDHDAQHRHAHRSYAIGCIHGLAGSGGLVVLAASAMDASHASVIFFASIFGAGSIAGMVAVAVILYLLLSRVDGRRIERAVRYAVGAVAVTVGLYMAATIVSSGELQNLTNL